MAKLVVFEKKFRDEIRDILFKTRMDRRKHWYLNGTHLI
jgi:hypothetical protein